MIHKRDYAADWMAAEAGAQNRAVMPRLMPLQPKHPPPHRRDDPTVDEVRKACSIAVNYELDSVIAIKADDTLGNE